MEFELEEKNNDVKRLERRINEMEESIDESDKRYNHLYALFKDNKKKISLYENKGRELSHDINQILDKAPQTRDEIGSSSQASQDKISSLQNKLNYLLIENKELNMQMEQINDNVRSFISQMSGMIEPYELSTTVNTMNQEQRLEEESGGSTYDDDQRQDYSRPAKKYTPSYHTSTQGGAQPKRSKRRVNK